MDLGADHAVIFTTDQIVFDPRTLLKCMFGCSDWGHGHTCPSKSGSLKPWEYQRIFEKYQWGCIIHSTSKKVSQDISFALEQEAFLAGHYFAFSLSDCAICGECTGFKGRPCVDPRRARPAFHSVGIDVFATVRQFELPLSTLASEDEEQNWYSAVFVA
jgi:predicted metal-binding protein